MLRLKLLLVLIVTLLQGCAGMYFKDAGVPPETPRYRLAELPSREYWTGIVFNGNKIGFSHLKLSADTDAPALTVIESEAALRFHFLTVDKSVKLLSRDRVNADLTLDSFTYDYDMDGNRMKLYGALRNGILDLIIESAAGQTTESYPLAAPLYPTSIVNLYPVVHGLEVGTRYQYDVYDGESQRITAVTQTVDAYETSELFAGEAWKITTRMHGQTVTTWINTNGEPLLEMSMNGVFIAALESESEAMQYLAQAALNKNETLLNYSLIRTDRPIESPRHVRVLEIELDGVQGLELPEPDARQQCAFVEGGALRCRVTTENVVAEVTDDEMKRYLGSTIPAPHGHPLIRETMLDIGGIEPSLATPLRVNALIDWIGLNIEPEAIDVFSALEVLEQRKAECQGYSYLYTSFARALGIPTRVVNGIVYSEQHPGFLYHTWVESLIEGQWQAIDPTFGQPVADATHIRLVEGEYLADLTPLLNMMGKVSARVIAVTTE